MSKKLHVFMNDKGGCGKTFAAWTFTQYLQHAGRSVTAIDCDATQKLASCAALHVRPRPIRATATGEAYSNDVMEAVAAIGEAVFSADENSEVIVDSGASGAYKQMLGMLCQQIVPQVSILGFELFFHSPITEPDMKITCDSVREIQSAAPGVPLVLWVSPHFSRVPVFNAAVSPKTLGIKTEQLRIVELPAMHGDTRAVYVSEIYKFQPGQPLHTWNDYIEGSAGLFDRELNPFERGIITMLRDLHFAAVAQAGF